MISVFPFFVKQKINAAAFAAALSSALTERLTVGTLILSGVCLVRTHQNPVQRAIVLIITVVSTGLNGAFDALICIVVHHSSSFNFEYSHSMAHFFRTIL